MKLMELFRSSKSKTEVRHKDGIFNETEMPEREVGGDSVIVNDFERRIPFWSYRAVNYKDYEPFTNLKTELDGYLKQLFKGEIDDGNGDVLDNLIADRSRQAKKDLARQRTDHIDTIKSFDIRARSDKKAFEDELALVMEQMEENRQTLRRYKERMARDEFMEVGQ